MRTSKGFNRRVHDAFADLQERRRKLLTQEDLAEMVAAEYDNGKPVTGTTVGRWLRYQDGNGSEPKSYVLIGALARALEVRTEWLAFGEGGMARDGMEGNGPAPVETPGPRDPRATGAEVLQLTQKIKDSEVDGGQAEGE